MTRHMTGTAQCGARAIEMNTNSVGSLGMYSMHEAMARERMLEGQRRAEEARAARRLASERPRRHRVSLRPTRRSK
jgi:hypothetical protein